MIALPRRSTAPALALFLSLGDDAPLKSLTELREWNLAHRSAGSMRYEQANPDALLFPGSSSAGIAAKPGYPTVIVPFGFVPNESGPPFPDGFEPRPQPYGVAFTGGACSEPRLLELAYAFEQATRRRVPPRSQ